MLSPFLELPLTAKLRVNLEKARKKAEENEKSQMQSEKPPERKRSGSELKKEDEIQTQNLAQVVITGTMKGLLVQIVRIKS
jgi:uncharacterized protein YaiL (DUF2058 family)